MKKTHIVLLFFMAIGLGALALQMGQWSTDKSIAEAKALMDKKVKLTGELNKSKGVEFNPEIDANAFSFYLVDEAGEEVKVVCFDDLPRDFELSDEVVVKGKLKSDGVFYADELLVKCPSKYVEDELGV